MNTKYNYILPVPENVKTLPEMVNHLSILNQELTRILRDIYIDLSQGKIPFPILASGSQPDISTIVESNIHGIDEGQLVFTESNKMFTRISNNVYSCAFG